MTPKKNKTNNFKLFSWGFSGTKQNRGEKEKEREREYLRHEWSDQRRAILTTTYPKIEININYKNKNKNQKIYLQTQTLTQKI